MKTESEVRKLICDADFVLQYLPPELRDAFIKQCEASDFKVNWDLNTAPALKKDLLRLPGIGNFRAKWLCQHSWLYVLHLTLIMDRPDIAVKLETQAAWSARSARSAYGLKRPPAVARRLFSSAHIRELRCWAAPFYPGPDKTVLAAIEELSTTKPFHPFYVITREQQLSQEK